MSRVDINGQFSYGSGCVLSKEKAKVDRQVTTLATVPRNWGVVCDKLDKALEEYTKLKSIFRVVGFSSYVFLAIFMIAWFSFNVLGYENSRLSFAPVVIWVFLTPCFFIFCWVALRTKAVMKTLEQICTEMSGNGVRYQLGNEWYGGCNKRYVRRYFIMVHIDEEEQVQAEATMIDNTDNTNRSYLAEAWITSDPFTTVGALDSTTGTNAKGQPSLLDQLKI